MKPQIKKLLPIIFLLAVFNIISCSKEDSTPVSIETTITAYDFSKTIDENPPVGFEIGTLLASTNQGSLSFSLAEQNPTGALSIDATSGKLKVADPSLFNFETNPVISGLAKITNEDVS